LSKKKRGDVLWRDLLGVLEGVGRGRLLNLVGGHLLVWQVGKMGVGVAFRVCSDANYRVIQTDGTESTFVRWCLKMSGAPLYHDWLQNVECA
jgi:hypothetical protein